MQSIIRVSKSKDLCEIKEGNLVDDTLNEALYVDVQYLS